MRLSVSVNGTIPTIASLPGPGYLNAHLNICDRPGESHSGAELRVVGSATGETETTHLHWPSADLKVGDVVELQVLPEGKGDEPVEIRKSSESPNNLFSRIELAEEMLAAVSEFETRLSLLLEKSEVSEAPDEHKKFVRAWGIVIYKLGQNLMYPVYRRHNELIPPELKNELL